MLMEERMLLKSSENISKLLTLMTLHEQNFRNHLRRPVDVQFIFDRLDLSLNSLFSQSILSNLSNLNELSDLSNLSNLSDSSGNLSRDLSHNLTIHYIKFSEVENPIDTTCPITQETFNEDDSIALLECGHYFKKDAFLLWSRRSRTCPSCRTAFR